MPWSLPDTHLDTAAAAPYHVPGRTRGEDKQIGGGTGRWSSRSRHFTSSGVQYSREVQHIFESTTNNKQQFYYEAKMFPQITRTLWG